MTPLPSEYTGALDLIRVDGALASVARVVAGIAKGFEDFRELAITSIDVDDGNFVEAGLDSVEASSRRRAGAGAGLLHLVCKCLCRWFLTRKEFAHLEQAVLMLVKLAKASSSKLSSWSARFLCS